MSEDVPTAVLHLSSEQMAEAMFARLHEINHRRRNWANHPDEDSGEELGRNTFREMAEAACRTSRFGSVIDGVTHLEEPVDVTAVEVGPAPEVETRGNLGRYVEPEPANDPTPPAGAA